MIIGVTGHRPTRLALRKTDTDTLDRFAAKVLGDLPQPAFTVVSGMQLGWDESVARACVLLNIPFTAAIPFEGFDANWLPAQREEHRRLRKLAARVHVVSEGTEYSQKKLKLRNEWIVDQSVRMLALWDGYDDGGTAQCVRYAGKRSVPVTNVWLDWRSFQFEDKRVILR